MSAIIIAIILTATLATAFLSSIFGMLGGLILMGVLASILPVASAMVLHGLIQLTSNGYRAWLNRRDVDWSIVTSLFIGNVLAMSGLEFIAFSPDRITVLLALGLLPYIAWALPEKLALDVSKRPVGLFAGAVVVATNLLAGVGGPLLDVFFQRVTLTRHQVVATKAVAQALGHISKIIFYGGLAASASTDDWPTVWLLGAAIIASIVGTTLGKRVLDRMQDATFFTWTQRIMLGVGAVLIARAIYLISL
ncbi:MAG: TSUP family transporter [Alphaproteobacteria bacterium]|nr:TSUP family transporter [Alphaproteobacteria bacterium]